MSVVVDGKPEEIPGVSTVSWLNGGLRLGTDDYRHRETSWIRSALLHTTKGDEPQILVPGAGPGGMAERTIRYWKQDPRHAGSHLVIDGPGPVWCCADLRRDVTYHATTINEVSISIEIAQSSRLEIWTVQLDILVRLLDWLTARFGIQRQYHYPYLGEANPVDRLAAGGGDAVGIFGHRDQTTNRSKGDPGDNAFRWLKDAGYEAFDFEANADKLAWIGRQVSLGLTADGVPGPRTVAALKTKGYRDGIWVQR